MCKPPGKQPHPGNDGWVQAIGINCYGTRDGGQTFHGANDLENPRDSSCGKMSISDCQKKCDDMDGCTAVVVGNDGSCYRKTDINIEACDNNASGFSDTFVKSPWVKAKGFNCWGARGGSKSHGANDLENPADSSAGTMSLPLCQ